jgi:tRNA(fMet)-specific endonuclease VapC
VRAFDAAAAEVSGRVAARLERSGVRIGPLDLLIGAHALAQGAVLLTANPSEFARIEGLSVVDSRSER